MIELPEASVLARQISETLRGRKIIKATANQSPHKFAWYTGDPSSYDKLLAGTTLRGASVFGNHVELKTGDKLLVISTRHRSGRGDFRLSKLVSGLHARHDHRRIITRRLHRRKPVGRFNGRIIHGIE